MIGRRTILGTIGCAVAVPAALAQPASDLPRIAIVEQGEPVERMVEGGHPWWDAFLVELRRLGHVEGQTIAIERQTAAGLDAAGLARLAATVVAGRPALIVARGIRAVTALSSVTPTIPIVGVGTLDALVTTARSGRNVTGINVTGGVEVYMKLLQLLHDSAPAAGRIAWLGPRDTWDGPIGIASRDGAAQLGVTLVPAIVQPPTGESTIRAAMASLAGQDVGGLCVGSAPEMTPYRGLIAELATAAALPAIALQREYADAGLLMAYSPDYLGIYRRAADFVDRILGGADPADMLIGQPDSFELIVNGRTAGALGITLPPSILIFATEIIE